MPAGVVTLAELAVRASAGPAAGACRFVSVDGPAGSGKSTLAARLARELGGAPVVDLDDFFSWTDLHAWWPRFEAEVLAPLAAGRGARFRRRDWVRDPHGAGLGAWREVPAAPFVVLDGVSSSRRAMAGRLALAVWVEAPEELRLRRGLERDGAELETPWRGWMAMEDAFFAGDGTRERADLRVDGAPSVGRDPGSEVALLR